MPEIATAAIALVIAGFAKGLVGLGLPPIAMGLLVIVMSPVEAAVIMVVPALLTNVWQAVQGPALRYLVVRFWLMLLLTALLTVVFAGALSAYANAAIMVLGALLVIYGGYSLRTPAFSLDLGVQKWLGPVSGAATGIVTAFTGVSSMPSVPFLQSVGLKRDVFVQAMGLSFSVSAVALLVALGLSGDISNAAPTTVVTATFSAFVGMAIGTAARRRLDERVFRTVFLYGLVLLGLFLLFR